MMLRLDRHTDQIVVTVVTDEGPAAVAAAAVASGVGAGVAHQVAVSLGEERRGEDACWGRRRVRAALTSQLTVSLQNTPPA